MITQAALHDINPRDLLTLTAEIHIGDGRTTADTNRWRNLGNIPGLEYSPNAENKTVMGSIRGIKRPLKAHTTQIDPKYTATTNELSDQVMDMIFYVDSDYDFGAAGSDNAQAGLSAATGTSFNFNEASDGKRVSIGDRTDVLDVDGNHVLAITALVLTGTEEAYGPGEDSTTLVENVDYELDPAIGQIRWLKEITNDTITTSITSSAITAADPNYMIKRKPNRIGYVEKLCRIYWHDQDKASNWVIWHKDFLGRFSVNNGFNADGESEAEPQLEIEILTDGTIFKRK